MDNFRKEFAQKLSETVITSTTPNEEVNRQVKELVNLITENLPQHIFRYRACTIRNIEALAKNMTYGAPMSFMNDPMDGLVYVDKGVLLKQFKFGLSREFYNLIKSTKHLPDSTELYLDKDTSDFILHHILNLSQGEVENIVAQNQQTKSEIIAKLDQIIDDKIKDLQESSLVVSFAETQYDNSMWAYYAKDHTGFVIEYEPQGMRFDYCSRCVKQNSPDCQDKQVQAILYPMIYQKERIDATAWLDSYIGLHIYQSIIGPQVKGYNPDELFSHRICLVKDEQWAHEREWRAVCTTKVPCEKGKFKPLQTPIPSAIYYGAHIAPESLSMLRGIIRALSMENNCEIKEYQMMIDHSSKDFKLNAVLL